MPQRAIPWIGAGLALTLAWAVPGFSAGRFPPLYAACALAGLALSFTGAFAGRRALLSGLGGFLCAWLLLGIAPDVVAELRGARDALVHGLVPSLIDGRETVKIWLLSQGRGIYPDMRDYPYLVTLYTPIYHSLAALAARTVVPGDVAGGGHLASYAGWVGLLCVMAWITRRETRSLFLAALVPLSFAAGPYMAGYIRQIRPDLLAWCLAFAATGLFAAKARDRATRDWPVAAAVCMAAALFTKQQTAAVCCALVTACLVGQAGVGLCLRFAALTGAMGLAAGAALYGLTDGAFLLHCVIYPARLAADASITNLDNAWPRLAAFARAYWGLLALFLLALADDVRRRRLHLLDWLALVHAPFLVKLVATWGADTNYFLGFCIILTLRAGALLGAFRAAGERGRAAALALALLLSPLTPVPRDAAGEGGAAAAAARDEALRRAVGGAEALVNAEGAAPLLVGGGGKLFFFDATESQFFERVGLWSFGGSRLARDIAARRFPVVVLRPTFQDPQVLRAIENTYALAETLPDYSVYRPKQGDIVVLADPLAPAAAGPVRLAESRGVEAGTGFGARFVGRRADAQTAEIVYAVAAPRPVAWVGLTFYPKVSSPGPESFIEAAWSADGVAYHPFARYAGSGDDNATGLFEPCLEAGFAPGAAAFFVRLTLSGSARLWTGDGAAMLLTLREPEVP